MGRSSKTTDKVLSFLERNRGSFVSGEKMAKECGVSRNSVWKAVKDLRESGYCVEAVSNKGYSLGKSNDIISEEGIRANLEPEISSGMDICVFASIGSTSDKAKEMAMKGAGHGTLVVSSRQTKGRGRKDHTFFSPDGGLYISMILSPEKFDISDRESLIKSIGDKVKNVIKELTGVVVKRKGINDLYVGDKKLCGILIESGSEFDSGRLQWLVVGIGINFDPDISIFPAELKEKVTSLFEPGQASVTKNELIAAIAGRILAEKQ
ncbi:MAG: biotin--[acetyl-CoA-carboxylase] ligase [Lachnospiraceae bacterium]|nr:biotin--[acetyl-CoA-carboxylase] ligase [Lachnospiraceae bacterium]